MQSLLSRLFQFVTPRLATVLLFAVAMTCPAFCAKKTPYEELCKAAQEGNAEKVDSLFRSVSPSADFSPCLIDAAGLGYLNVVQVMVAHGVDIDAGARGGLPDQHTVNDPLVCASNLVWFEDQNPSPGTPLIAAIRGERFEVVRWLVEHGANLDLQEGALVFKDMRRVNGLTTFTEMAVEHGGNNALSEAILAGNTAIVQFLVDHGADLSRRLIVFSATIPSVKGFVSGFVLDDGNGNQIRDNGTHIRLGADCLVSTDLEIKLQQELTVRDLALHSIHPEIRAIVNNAVEK